MASQREMGQALATLEKWRKSMPGTPERFRHAFWQIRSASQGWEVDLFPADGVTNCFSATNESLTTAVNVAINKSKGMKVDGKVEHR